MEPVIKLRIYVVTFSALGVCTSSIVHRKSIRAFLALYADGEMCIHVFQDLRMMAKLRAYSQTICVRLHVYVIRARVCVSVVCAYIRFYDYVPCVLCVCRTFGTHARDCMCDYCELRADLNMLRDPNCDANKFNSRNGLHSLRQRIESDNAAAK